MTVEDNELDTTTTEVIETPVVQADVDIGDAYDRAMAVRDEQGRFAAKNPPLENGASPAGGEGAEEADAASTVAQVSSAPAHLPQAIKADWDKIPEPARNAIVAHQTEMDRKFGEIGKQYGTVKPVADKLLNAASQIPEFRGMTPDQIADGALKLAAVQAQLGKGPQQALQTILEVARAYNVLPMLAQSFSNTPPTEQAQLVSGLQQKIANLESQISRAGNPDMIREQITATMTERETEKAVRDFAAGKDFWADVEANLPPFVEMVRDDPASAGKSPSDILNEAYDMAINALPAVREKVRAAEAAKAATAAAADPARTDKARKAASINVKNTSGGERKLTELEAMSSAYDRAMAN